MSKEKLIWLTGQGVKTRCGDNKYKESLFNITLQNIHIRQDFYPDIGQTHMTMNRDDLVLLKNAINEKLKEE